MPPRSSLRTQLIVNFAVLTAAAIVIAIGGAIVFARTSPSPRASLYLALIVVADLLVIVGIGAASLQRLVIRPLRSVVEAAEEIAGGKLDCRAPTDGSRDLHELADSVNRVTDRLLDERAQLVRAEKLASIGRLAAGIAHGVGSPLGAVNEHTKQLRAHLNGATETAEALAGIERETTRIDRIVHGLLDYARRRTPLRTAVSVNDAIQSSLELLVTQGALRDVAVSLNLDSTEPCVIGDRPDLEQMFVNLLLNAVDALQGSRGPSQLVIYSERVERALVALPAARRTPPDGQPVVMHRPPSRAESWALQHSGEAVVRVVVADSGPGVPADDAERIFDPFFTTKQHGKGTGLGLAIVSRIVDNFHGTVWVAPAREGGAAFHMLFPAAP